MKKIILITLTLILMLELTGCETLQRKFTRKKKKQPIKPRFYQEGLAETRPNLELYMMHYTYWKSWHEDLVVNAGVNSKRDALACSEVIGNLLDMKKRLVEEKAKELDIYIEQLKKITKELMAGGSTAMRLGYLKQRMDMIRSRIVRKFYYKKVREYIKPDSF